MGDGGRDQSDLMFYVREFGGRCAIDRNAMHGDEIQDPQSDR